MMNRNDGLIDPALSLDQEASTVSLDSRIISVYPLLAPVHLSTALGLPTPLTLTSWQDMRECACTTLGTCATYDGHMDKMLQLNFVARLGPLLSMKHKPLKFSAARGLRNIAATSLGSEAICKDASCISSLEKAMRNIEEEDFIIEISACVSNCSLISDNLFTLLTPRMCKSVPPPPPLPTYVFSIYFYIFPEVFFFTLMLVMTSFCILKPVSASWASENLQSKTDLLPYHAHLQCSRLTSHLLGSHGRYMVMILKKGCNTARIHICKAVKAVGNSMSGYFQGQLCDAGVIPALVALLEVDVTATGSVAGSAAGAIARLVATDENVGARIVELAGLGMLVYLLRDGDAGSRAQACKCLWMICQNDAYKLMLLQVPTRATIPTVLMTFLSFVPHNLFHSAFSSVSILTL